MATAGGADLSAAELDNCLERLLKFRQGHKAELTEDENQENMRGCEEDPHRAARAVGAQRPDAHRR